MIYCVLKILNVSQSEFWEASPYYINALLREANRAMRGKHKPVSATADEIKGW